MTWSSAVNSQFKSYQSLYSFVTSDSVIYFELSPRILIYFWIDFVQNKRQSISGFTAFNEADDAAIFWDIKNVEQLNQ